MHSQSDQRTNGGAGGEGRSYRFSHPVRYAALAALLAAVVAGPLDLLLFQHDAVHAFKAAVLAAATWFVALVGGLWFVRLKEKDSR